MWSGAGFDFGNKYCVVGIPQSRSISVLLDQASNRLIPSLVGYSDKRRVFGSLAQQEMLQNLSGTITQLKKLVCLKFDSEERKYLENILNFDIVKLPNGFTGIKIQEKLYLPEQIIAFMLKSLMKLATASQPAVAAFCISVCPWWTQSYRQAIIDSCKISNINLIALVNSTTAAAVGYAMDHRAKLPKANEKPLPIAFIDIGDSSMNVAIAFLKEDNVTIGSFAFDEHFGGSNFTEKLLNYLIEQTKQKYKIDPRENKRMMHRFTEAIEKLKKNLSINTSIQFEVIGLKGDTDIRFIVKREEFEAQITDLIPRIQNPIISALNSANIKKEDLYACELLGGCSRIPIVKAEIAKIIGKEPEQAVNIDECFAIGAGYISAILNPSMSVPMTFADITPHDVAAAWKDKDGTKMCEIFPQFSKIPSTKLVPLNLTQETTVIFGSNNSEICRATIKPPKDVAEIFIRVKMTQSSTFEVVGIFYKDKANNDEEKTVDSTVIYKYGLSDADIQKYYKEELELSQKDEYENKVDETRNELESFIFKSEHGLQRDFPECFDPSQIQSVKDTVQKVHNWFSEHEFDRLELNEYKKRLDELKSHINPAIQRSIFWKQVKDNGNALKDRATALLDKIKNTKLPNDKKKEISEKAKKFVDDFSKLLENASHMKEHDNPPFNFTEQEDNVKNLENEFEIASKEAKSQGSRCYIA